MKSLVIDFPLFQKEYAKKKDTCYHAIYVHFSYQLIYSYSIRDFN